MTRHTAFGNDFTAIKAISEVYSLRVNGSEIPVHVFDPRSDASRVDFAWIFAPHGADVSVSTKSPITNYDIAPKAYNISVEVLSSGIEFNAGNNRYIQVRLNELHTLILFIEEQISEPPPTQKCQVLESAAYGIDSSGAQDVTEAFQRVVDLAAAEHDVLVIPAGVYSIQRLRLPSHSHLYLEMGAVINAVPDAAQYPQFQHRIGDKRAREDFILCEDQEQIIIEGPGIINANGISLALSAGVPESRPYPHGEIENVKMSLMTIKGEGSRNIIIRDVLVLESTEWAVTFYDCDNVLVDRVKVINYADWFWSDGVHFTSCRDATCQYSYAWCGDDAFVATTRVANAPSQHVRFHDNVAGFTTCTGLRAGWYARSPMSDVVFEDNIIISAGRGIDLLHYGYHGAEIRDIVFRRTVVEEINDDGSTWQNRCPIFFDMRRQDEREGDPGMVINVVVDDFIALHWGPHPSTVTSWNATAFFKNVRFSGVSIAGIEVASAELARMRIDNLSEGITFSRGEDGGAGD